MGSFTTILASMVPPPIDVVRLCESGLFLPIDSYCVRPQNYRRKTPGARVKIAIICHESNNCAPNGVIGKRTAPLTEEPPPIRIAIT